MVGLAEFTRNSKHTHKNKTQTTTIIERSSKNVIKMLKQVAPFGLGTIIINPQTQMSPQNNILKTRVGPIVTSCT